MLYTAFGNGHCQGPDAALATESQNGQFFGEYGDLAEAFEASILQLHHKSPYNEMLVLGLEP